MEREGDRVGQRRKMESCGVDVRSGGEGGNSDWLSPLGCLSY